MALEKFVEFFKGKEMWKECLDEETGVFLKLLKIPGLFNSSEPILSD